MLDKYRLPTNKHTKESVSIMTLHFYKNLICPMKGEKYIHFCVLMKFNNIYNKKFKLLVSYLHFLCSFLKIFFAHGPTEYK